MSAINGEKYAVLLMNMGGPQTINDIQPFLYNLFSDRDIIQFPIPFFQSIFAKLISKLRSPHVAKHYQKIGGGSPILSITTQQALALEIELNKSIHSSVHIAMRYTEPSTDIAIKRIQELQCTKLIILPLYPHYSSTTTGSSFNELQRVLQKIKNMIPVIYIKEWFDNDDYIDALSMLIQEKLSLFDSPSETHIIFSAHSLPLKTVQKGDPYPKQIESTVKRVMIKLSIKNPYYISYQSKVGPIKWLEPSTENTIRNISKQFNHDILMVPISFVSDHYETNYEIDIYYYNIAKSLDIKKFMRVESLNCNSTFISALAKLVLHSIEKDCILE